MQNGVYTLEEDPQLVPVKAAIEYQQWTKENPVEWAQEVLGVYLWRAQRDVIESIVDNPMVAWASSNAIGKGFCNAVITIWFMQWKVPGYVILSSAGWRTVEKGIWPEIRRVIIGSKLKLGGDLQTTRWVLGNQWEAFGLAADEPENFAGIRTPNGGLIINDEGSALEQPIMESIDGIMAGGNYHFLFTGNPLRPEGPFYEAFKNPEYKCFRTSAFESPNYIHNEIVIPGLACRKWVEAKKVEWGEDSPTYVARVKGDFPDHSEDYLVPMKWVDPQDTKPKGDLWLGADIGRYGSDRTVLVGRDETGVRFKIIKRGLSCMESAGLIIATASEHKIPANRANVDDIGVGGGVTDKCDEEDFSVNKVNFAENAVDYKRFANVRAECYWMVRDSLSPKQGIFRLSREHTNLGKELTNIKYGFTSKGQIIIEEKKQIKKRTGGKSPDEADALALSHYVNTRRMQLEF
jgi:phage terminase large subunit